MKEEMQMSAQNNNGVVMLDSHVSNIKDCIDRIASDFFRVGYYLWEIKHFKWYAEKGYKDIVEFAEKELNFKRRSTYNFLSIVENFAEWDLKNNYPKMWIADKYSRLGYSQLAEMLSLSDSQREVVNENMTIKEIRQLKKEDAPNDFIDVAYVDSNENLKNNDLNDVERAFLFDVLKDKYNWITMMLGEKEIKDDKVRYKQFRDLEDIYFSVLKKLE